MSSMFENSRFNQDISNWDISSLRHVRDMFRASEFSHNLYRWTLDRPDLKIDVLPDLIKPIPCVKWIEYDKSK
jgi:hypothetical protein